MTKIKIPQSENASVIDEIQIDKNIVIVGANGSGKTRLGSRIEHINNPSKRISAQRYLALSEVVQKDDFETADSLLRSVYKNQSPVTPQNDYSHVLVSLFAEESRRNEQAVDSLKSKGELKHAELIPSVKERVIEIWNFVFPHRALKLEKDRVRAVNETEEFSGAEMSDGEKVGLYLIAQVLLADKNCILVIDEPELHLHKSLMVRLWNKLEEQRRDCVFIYITHDLDFAVSKPASKILWVQSYKNNQWKWSELDSSEAIPENLYLEVLGSRKPILFIEGDRGSPDVQIYQSFYENFTVIPVHSGSCEKVIASVRALRNNESLHNNKVYGLIDRDFRTEDEVNSLKNEGIFCLGVKHVENLFLIPDVIAMVCNYCLRDPKKKDEVITEIKKTYIAELSTIKFRISKYRIQQLLNRKFSTVEDEKGYEEFKISIFQESDLLLNSNLPDGSDVVEILKIYPHKKSLISKVQSKLELKGKRYMNLVLSFFSSAERKEIISILDNFLPKINI